MNTNNENGFSLIEILCVLVLMSIICSILVFKIVDLGDSADIRVIETTVSGFNSAEKLTWTNLKLRGEYVDDPDLFTKVKVNFELGDCSWLSFDASGGRLKCGKAESDLLRIPSGPTKPALW